MIAIAPAEVPCCCCRAPVFTDHAVRLTDDRAVCESCWFRIAEVARVSLILEADELKAQIAGHQQAMDAIVQTLGIVDRYLERVKHRGLIGAIKRLLGGWQ